jgi:hypothetical protein
VRVANGEIVKAKNRTTYPFPQLSERARQADTFEQFPNSLMSVGQTADDGTISIFTKDGVTVHKEEKVQSHAKESQSSLVSGMSMEDIESHSCNNKDSGNHNDHQRKQLKRSMKLIVCMISHPLSKQLNGCMQCADT